MVQEPERRPTYGAIADSAERLVEDVLAACPRAASSELHGERHWRSVAATGLRLIATGVAADPELVVLFALLHDSCRENDGRDPQHGPRAARFARALRAEHRLTLEEDRHERLDVALRDHTRPGTSDDPTIGACWDADRLNLCRLHPGLDAADWPPCVDRSLMSTKSGRSAELAAWTATRYSEPPSWPMIIAALA